MKGACACACNGEQAPTPEGTDFVICFVDREEDII